MVRISAQPTAPISTLEKRFDLPGGGRRHLLVADGHRVVAVDLALHTAVYAQRLGAPELAREVSRGVQEGGRSPAARRRLPRRRRRLRLDRLPRLHELRDPAARTVCLERFANHELMAVELFAWVLLAYPEMPAALRGGYLRVLEEEQAHLRMYLDFIC